MSAAVRVPVLTGCAACGRSCVCLLYMTVCAVLSVPACAVLCCVVRRQERYLERKRQRALRTGSGGGGVAPATIVADTGVSGRVTALRRARMAPNTRLLASVIKDGVDTNAKLDAAEVARVRALLCWDCGGCGRS